LEISSLSIDEAGADGAAEPALWAVRPEQFGHRAVSAGNGVRHVGQRISYAWFVIACSLDGRNPARK
jgi:hypothetical protein